MRESRVNEQCDPAERVVVPRLRMSLPKPSKREASAPSLQPRISKTNFTMHPYDIQLLGWYPPVVPVPWSHGASFWDQKSEPHGDKPTKRGWSAAFTAIAKHQGLETEWNNGAPKCTGHSGSAFRGSPLSSCKSGPLVHSVVWQVDTVCISQIFVQHLWQIRMPSRWKRRRRLIPKRSKDLCRRLTAAKLGCQRRPSTCPKR